MSTNQDDKYKNYNCKICLEVASEPIVTLCGHLYCWNCLFKWSETKGNPFKCPYCSNMVDINKCTTLFAGEGQSQKQQSEIPKRPQNPRTNFNQNINQNNQNINQNNQNGFFQNFHFSLGLGLPFMLFSNMNFGGNNNQVGGRQNSFWGILVFVLVIMFQILASIEFSEEEISKPQPSRRRTQKVVETDNNYHDIASFVVMVIMIVGINWAMKIYNRQRQRA